MRRERKQASLHFGPTHRPEGFTSGALAQFDGSAEPVVRELLQNSLDAADQANRSAEVQFEVDEVASDLLPGWDEYLTALSRARQARLEWHKGRPSQDEKMVVDRIDTCISGDRIPLLSCVDNGHGLDRRRMDSLLTPGNTSKGDHGAGSFGLGHHAAFGASDLRFVLYASKYRDGKRLRNLASGHCILAAHRESVGSGWRAADGYWFRTGHGDNAFTESSEPYPDTPPRLLVPYLDALTDTGTVVCIAGFNDFNRDAGEPSAVEMICRVASANFSDAINSGRLAVTVVDRRGPADNQMRLQLRTLSDAEAALSAIKDQQRSGTGRAGHITGSVAYNALLTLRDGNEIVSPDGVAIRIRRIDGTDRPRTQVHIFRRGMWITSRAHGLAKSDFSRQEPFDAVLALDRGPLEEVVRAAEGPEHRGLDKGRLSTHQRKQLREGLGEIAELLRKELGERADLQEYIPPGFATLEGQVTRAAEKVRRPRSPSGGGSSKNPVNGGKKRTHGEKDEPRRTGTPNPGTTPLYRSSLRATAGGRRVTAHLAYGEEVPEGGQIGVRLRSASGADGSCESPLSDQFLRIVSVDDGGDRMTTASDGVLELVLPAKEGRRTLTVTLSAPVQDPRLLELDLVRRRPPATAEPSDQTESG